MTTLSANTTKSSTSKQTTNSPKRMIGVTSLTMIAVGSMVGSGWLFGAYRASEIAGPAAIFAWIIGAVAVLLTALTFMEVATALPVPGGPVKYLEKTHGSVVGFLASWAIWLSFVSVIPVEAEASVQYMASWPWEWVKPLTSQLFDPSSGSLTWIGLSIAVVLMLVYFFLNFWSINLFTKSVNAITTYKLVVPVLTVLMIVYAGFHPGNFEAVHHTIAPYGWSSVLTAVAISGIVFAYNGFQASLFFSGEAVNPSKSIPKALIYSIVFCAVLYVGLQIAFIGGVNPDNIALHGWHLNFSSPFAELALILGLHALTLLLFIDAFISPSGTGIGYMGTVSRQLFGMSENGYMPKSCKSLDKKYGVPRTAMIINFIVGLIFLDMFRGWGQLAAVISVATVISFMVGPLTFGSLRKIAPELKRPVYLKWGHIISPLSFVISSELFYWSTWPLTGKVVFVILIGFLIFSYFQLKKGLNGLGKHIRSSIWIIAMFAVMTLISYIGSSQFGGINILHYGWGMFAVAVSSLVFYYWGINSAWVTPMLEETLKKDFAK
ncbi:APC family permease [Vibrio sp. S4M6]|uniref:APC family permease n=1 Tax=Vibrio sinus TaxID=2946865 RepID=UPI00202A3A12|nr:APC family permease [Vibrio sinus]MCL9781180.1 APC family permease [Vibrio sinus]